MTTSLTPTVLKENTFGAKKLDNLTDFTCEIKQNRSKKVKNNDIALTIYCKR